MCSQVSQRGHDCSYPKRRLLIAIASVSVAAVVLIVLLWPGSADEDETLFTLEQTQAGLVCEILRDSSEWSSVYVWVTDGNDSGGVLLDSSTLEGGEWATAEYCLVSVGELMLSVSVIDVEGDGSMGRGDSIIVTAVNSSEFSSTQVYEFGLWIGHLAIYGTEYRMSFWFEDGMMTTGNLEIRWYPG